MAFERTWPAVAPRLLTATGSTTGLIQVSDTRGFKVKGKAVLQSVTKAATAVEVKRVLSDTQMIIGAIGTPITDRSFDASVFTTADNAFIYAPEQEKVKVPQIDREHATYEQEPTVAWRTVNVDALGRFYDKANPTPVGIGDGTNEVKVYEDGSIGSRNLTKLVKVPYDQQLLTYDPISHNLTGITYKMTGVIVATVSLIYDSYANLIEVKVV